MSRLKKHSATRCRGNGQKGREKQDGIHHILCKNQNTAQKHSAHQYCFMAAARLGGYKLSKARAHKVDFASIQAESQSENIRGTVSQRGTGQIRPARSCTRVKRIGRWSRRGSCVLRAEWTVLPPELSADLAGSVGTVRRMVKETQRYALPPKRVGLYASPVFL